MTAESPTARASDALAGLEARPGVPKPDPVIVADGVVRAFGGLVAVDVDRLEVQRGVITALIGPNGAGKTTFFNLLTGFDTADEGTRSFNGRLLDRRYALPDLPTAVRLALGGLGSLVGLGLLAWILARVADADGGGFVVRMLLAIVVSAVAVVAGRNRRGLMERFAFIGMCTAVGTILAGLFGLMVGPTANWLTVTLWSGWFVGLGVGYGAWRWATGPLPPHEVAQLGMVRTFQLTKALSRLSVIENMRLGASGQKGEKFASALFQTWRSQEAENTERADALLDRFLLTRMRDEFAGTLSGGQRKLLEMARALMTEPEVVMLDEPMAGVNPALTQSLLGHITSLRDDGMTVMFVEHDMDVVREISDWVVVMAEGRIIFEGPPTEVGKDQRVIDAYLGAHHDRSLEELDTAALDDEVELELDAEEQESQEHQR